MSKKLESKLDSKEPIIETNIAQKIDDEVIVQIYDGSLKHRTRGPLYKIKSEPIEKSDGENFKNSDGDIEEKIEYYMQYDELTDKPVFFAIKLKKGFDITSVMGHLKKIQVNPSEIMKIWYIIMGVELLLIIILTLALVAPFYFMAYVIPLMNVPTLLGYFIAFFVLLYSLYQKANYERVWLGNFIVVYRQTKPIKVILEQKEITKNPEILFIRLYESARVNTKEVFGYDANDIAAMIQKDLIDENRRLNNEIIKLKEQLAAETAEKDKLLYLLSEDKKKFELYWELGYRTRAKEEQEIKSMEGTTLDKLIPVIRVISILGFIAFIVYMIVNNVYLMVPADAVWAVYIIVAIVAFIIAKTFNVNINLGKGGSTA